jgi:glycogen debranching enzyme
VLRLSLHPGTTCTKNGVLKSDFPMDGGVFERRHWKERKLPSDVSKSVQSQLLVVQPVLTPPPAFRPVHVDLPISAPGAFCYFIEHDASDGTRTTGRKGYFNVDPLITLPARTPLFPSSPTAHSSNPLDDKTSGAVQKHSTNLHLDGLAILSVLAKWMGTTKSWEPHFSEASRRGYNMLHWAPLQQRGASGSPYSIKDQLRFDTKILENPEAKDGGFEEIEEVLRIAKEKYGLGGVTDVVLNHVAYDSPYLEEHPEAGQSLCNRTMIRTADADQVTLHITPLISPLLSSWKMRY